MDESQNMNTSQAPQAEPSLPQSQKKSPITRKEKRSGKGKKVLTVVFLFLLLCGVTYVAYWYGQEQAQKETDTEVAELQSQIDKLQKNSEDSSAGDGALYDTSKLVAYSDDGVAITKQADLIKLEGASNEFKQFINTELIKLQNESSDSGCNQPASIGVKKIYDDRVAVGVVGSCGGAQILWAKDSEKGWIKIGGTQNIGFQCDALIAYRVPQEITGSPYCIKNSEVRKYTGFTVGEVVPESELN